jgi:hypothetical protein
VSTAVAEAGAVRLRTDTGRSRAGIRLAVLGLSAALAGTLTVFTLHLLPATRAISPVRRTISEYAYSSLGWVFSGGVVLVSAGSLLVLAALWAAGTVRRLSVGTIALTTWSVALLVLMIFPKHNWAVGPSTSGSIHRAASLVAFLSVPVAAIAIGITGRETVWGRLSISFGAISGVLFSCILGAAFLAPFTGTPWYRAFPLGLMERGIAIFAVLAVLSLGALALRTLRLKGRISEAPTESRRQDELFLRSALD